ncbi:hypothetical protein HID58_015178 [Brassica napus]|uniref:Uncharacterized protein n=1 Tax=Brassica napus TaxID=3708 RepID=A0ABQ8DLT3_BRANA|nr:hypothetical protein HID58_015178 [Brassica napus]
MSKHVIIKNRKPKKSKRYTPLLSRLSRAREYTIADVRRCIRSQPYEVTDKECRNIFRHARLRGLANHPLRTLPSYTDEMKSCLRYGNREAHYIGGVKHLFALHDRTKGMRHLKISATMEKQHICG